MIVKATFLTVFSQLLRKFAGCFFLSDLSLGLLVVCGCGVCGELTCYFHVTIGVEEKLVRGVTVRRWWPRPGGCLPTRGVH
jgi:hypothetical protein